MKQKLIRFTAITASVILMAAPLSACGKKAPESISYETWWTSDATNDSSQTSASESQGDTTPSETTEYIIPTPSDVVENPLTGLVEMDINNVGKRGAAVSVNNARAANPSRGTSDASVIFEYETEGGQTRMLCVYEDISKIPLIGSIRSGRVGSADMAAGTGAIFFSWGADPTAVPAHVRNNNISWVDLNRNIFEYGKGHDAGDVSGNCFCWYDREWKSQRAQEHCGVSRGDFLVKAVEYNNIDINGEMPRLFHFVESGTAKMTDSVNCSEVSVYFSSTNDDALFVYNPEECVYYKSQYEGQPQMDINNDTQIHFTNVFVLYCPINLRPGDTSSEHHVDIHMEEGGTGYYISYGKAEAITWTKPTPNDLIKCYDKNGNEIEVNAGKSYICVVDDDEISKLTMN
ncbi:MAG: DUF3048 C-terminal domain-containing protein [Clostridiales bacterium]|nr:DUF3048 C-terminal domain-containing protein [Clostridiales bacterium]